MQDYKNQIAIITGANAGLGFETAKQMAGLGIKTILACRNIDKAAEARRLILKSFPNAEINIKEIDTSSLKSVKRFAESFSNQYQRLDYLINNAGMMMTPFKLTEDGFENQLATNYLGHFALTGLLMPLLKKTDGARIISLSSLAHKWAEINFEDINFKSAYNKRTAYGQSKLACLIFAYELDRQLKANAIDAISVAAHPGVSNTGLFDKIPRFKWLTSFMGQSPKSGAKPILYASLADELKGGEYIGPDGFGEYFGNPKPVNSNKASKNTDSAKKLWELSEKMTGVHFDFSKH